MKKRGFVLVELLVAMFIGTIVLGMIFGAYRLFNNIIKDSIDAARTTYNINIIKQIILDNTDNEYSIENRQLKHNDDVVVDINFDGNIRYYEDQDYSFKRCIVSYGDKDIDFVVKEIEEESK